MPLPYVIDMRHDAGADSTYGVALTLKDALAIAGKFWESYEGEFDPEAKNVKDMFKVGDGYVEELDLKLTRTSFFLMHAGGDGPFIRIERAKEGPDALSS